MEHGSSVMSGLDTGKKMGLGLYLSSGYSQMPLVVLPNVSSIWPSSCSPLRTLDSGIALRTTKQLFKM